MKSLEQDAKKAILKHISQDKLFKNWEDAFTSRLEKIITSDYYENLNSLPKVGKSIYKSGTAKNVKPLEEFTMLLREMRKKYIGTHNKARDGWNDLRYRMIYNNKKDEAVHISDKIYLSFDGTQGLGNFYNNTVTSTLAMGGDEQTLNEARYFKRIRDSQIDSEKEGKEKYAKVDKELDYVVEVLYGALGYKSSFSLTPKAIPERDLVGNAAQNISETDVADMIKNSFSIGYRFLM